VIPHPCLGGAGGGGGGGGGLGEGLLLWEYICSRFFLVSRKEGGN
jgi:hypothetical protein